MEYTLAVLKCKKRALTAEEKAAVEASLDIDSKYSRPTSDEVKALLEKITSGAEEAEESETPEDAKDL